MCNDCHENKCVQCIGVHCPKCVPTKQCETCFRFVCEPHSCKCSTCHGTICADHGFSPASQCGGFNIPVHICKFCLESASCGWMRHWVCGDCALLESATRCSCCAALVCTLCSTLCENDNHLCMSCFGTSILRKKRKTMT